MNCDSWQLKTMKPTNNNQQLSIEKTDFQKLKRSLINIKRQAQNNKTNQIKTRSE